MANESSRVTHPTQEVIGSYKRLVDLALKDPLFARGISGDDDLPSWMQAIGEQLAGDELRPALRAVIRDCSLYPDVARRWNAAASRGTMPDWFARYTDFMGRRRKWSL